MGIFSLNRDEKTILKRVAGRAPYSAHIGQRLLFGWAWGGLLDIMNSQKISKVLGGLLFCTSIVAAAIFGVHDITIEQMIVRLFFASLGFFFLVYFFAQRTSAPITLQQSEKIHLWMSMHPELAEAAAQWLTGQEVLRARDTRLLEWAHEKLEKLKAEPMVEAAACETKNVTRDDWWNEVLKEHRQAFAHWGTLGGNMLFPSDVTAKEHQALTGMTESVMRLADVAGARVHGRWKTTYIMMNSMSKNGLKTKGFDTVLTDFGGLWAVGLSLITLMAVGVMNAAVMVGHGFDMTSATEEIKRFLADERVMWVFFGVAGLWTWAAGFVYFNARPLHSGELDLMSEVFSDHPLVRDAFLKKVQGGTVFRLRHLWGVLQARNVMTDVQQGQKERLYSQKLAASLAHLPAAQIAAARAQQNELERSIGVLHDKQVGRAKKRM